MSRYSAVEAAAAVALKQEAMQNTRLLLLQTKLGTKGPLALVALQ